MENPINPWMIWGENPTIFGNTHVPLPWEHFEAFHSFEWKGFLAASAKKRHVGKLKNFGRGVFWRSLKQWGKEELQTKFTILVGGFKYVSFSPLLGEDEPILTNMGWNHQLEIYYKYRS